MGFTLAFDDKFACADYIMQFAKCRSGNKEPFNENAIQFTMGAAQE